MERSTVSRSRLPLGSLRSPFFFHPSRLFISFSPNAVLGAPPSCPNWAPQITPKFPSHSLPNACHASHPGNGVALVRRKRLHSPFTIVQFRITKINTWLPFLGFLFFTLSLGASMNFYTSELAAYWQGAVPWFWSWAGRAKEKRPGDEVANLRMQESLSEEKKPSLYFIALFTTNDCYSLTQRTSVLTVLNYINCNVGTACFERYLRLNRKHCWCGLINKFGFFHCVEIPTCMYTLS